MVPVVTLVNDVQCVWSIGSIIDNIFITRYLIGSRWWGEFGSNSGRSEYFDLDLKIREKRTNGEGFDTSDRSVSVRFKRTSNVPPSCGAKSQLIAEAVDQNGHHLRQTSLLNFPPKEPASAVQRFCGG